MTNEYLDIVNFSNGANPVLVVKNEEIGRNVNFDENQAERLYRELDHSLKTIGLIPDEDKVIEDLSWSDIIPVISDSENRIDLFISQFENRDWEEIDQQEFEDFLGHLKDARKDLQSWKDEYYYEDQVIGE